MIHSSREQTQYNSKAKVTPSAHIFSAIVSDIIKEWITHFCCKPNIIPGASEVTKKVTYLFATGRWQIGRFCPNFADPTIAEHNWKPPIIISRFYWFPRARYSFHTWYYSWHFVEWRLRSFYLITYNEQPKHLLFGIQRNSLESMISLGFYVNGRSHSLILTWNFPICA